MPGHDPTIPGSSENVHRDEASTDALLPAGEGAIVQPIRAEGGTAAGCDGVAKSLGVQQLEQGGSLGQSK